ncbi:hypothetical protein PYH37_005508 [Sinorhizobium numidicum]|uniref:Uncharacterized protein n=1 Tax=Sinorhizobium numidicum TaxID=680248 RepID=A0ABY8CYS3_9HYPH|nr:hypothetical protein [Sinorhizobium numidicum]WEX77134.1 hypothetical protein PYH37_005508 [Sinorhizobium numidicum]WEX83793.1 hypothetical protein PYH38_002601 [Sinorhizobium numidicum]
MSFSLCQAVIVCGCIGPVEFAGDLLAAEFKLIELVVEPARRPAFILRIFV